MARNPRSQAGAQSAGAATQGETVNDTDETQAGGDAQATETTETSSSSNLTVAQQIAAASAQSGRAASGGGARKAGGGGGGEKKTGGGQDARAVLVNDPDNNFQPVKRADLIRRLWTVGKMSRSDITRVLNDARVNPTPDKVVPYQIVFAATKGVPGGPDKGATAAPATVAADAPANPPAPVSTVDPATGAAVTVGAEGQSTGE